MLARVHRIGYRNQPPATTTVIGNAGDAPAAVIHAVSPYRGTPSITTSATSRSVSGHDPRPHAPRPRPRITVTSAKPPSTRRPTGRCQHRSSNTPGFVVTISTICPFVNEQPNRSAAIRATFISPSRFLVPDGPQSEPRHTRTPHARASSINVVCPYNTRFDNGDHTTPPAVDAGHFAQLAGSTAQQ